MLFMSKTKNKTLSFFPEIFKINFRNFNYNLCKCISNELQNNFIVLICSKILTTALLTSVVLSANTNCTLKADWNRSLTIFPNAMSLCLCTNIPQQSNRQVSYICSHI